MMMTIWTFFDDSDDEDEEAKAAAEALKAKRVAEYNARKAEKAAKKGVVAAKSMITLDVKPFDDETDLDGLVWGQKHEKKTFGVWNLQTCHNCCCRRRKSQ